MKSWLFVTSTYNFLIISMQRKKCGVFFCFWLLYLFFFVFEREKCIILQLLKVASRCGVGRGRMKGMTPLLSLKMYIFRTNRYTIFSTSFILQLYKHVYLVTFAMSRILVHVCCICSKGSFTYEHIAC